MPFWKPFKSLIDAQAELRAMSLNFRAAELKADGRFEEAHKTLLKGLRIMENNFGDTYQTALYSYSLAALCLDWNNIRVGQDHIFRAETVVKKAINELLERPIGDEELIVAVSLAMEISALKDGCSDLEGYLTKIFSARFERFGQPDRMMVKALLDEAKSDLDDNRLLSAEGKLKSILAALEQRGETNTEDLKTASMLANATRRTIRSQSQSQ